MQLEVLKFLADILASIEILESYHVDKISITEFNHNNMMIDAAERRLIIIGEALYQVSKLSKDIEISEKRKIMGLRHILVHDYDKVNPETLYIIITRHLSLLKAEVGAILLQHPPTGSLSLDD